MNWFAFGILLATLTVVVVLPSAVRAQEGSVAHAGARQTKAAGTAIATTPEPDLTPSPVVDTPPTPGPPTPTPALPEEGGPPGGVISGFLFVDSDGSGSRSEGDLPVGDTVLVYLVNEGGQILDTRSALTGAEGKWEVRALADGRYRIVWQPPLRDPADLARTIPPAEEVQLTPLESVMAVTQIVEIVDGSRVTEVEFGIPSQTPIAMPSTGEPSGAEPAWATYAMLAAGFGIAALGLTATRLLKRRQPRL
jgi:hypothetical protein